MKPNTQFNNLDLFLCWRDHCGRREIEIRGLLDGE